VICGDIVGISLQISGDIPADFLGVSPATFWGYPQNAFPHCGRDAPQIAGDIPATVLGISPPRSSGISPQICWGYPQKIWRGYPEIWGNPQVISRISRGYPQNLGGDIPQKICGDIPGLSPKARRGYPQKAFGDIPSIGRDCESVTWAVSGTVSQYVTRLASYSEVLSHCVL
jgi:hypothetical protein